MIRRLFALGLVAAAACDAADVYIYTARKVEATCLDPYEAIDQIDGDGAKATCAPTCFTLDDDTYVSTVCPPLPANAVPIPATDPACIAASRWLDAACGDDAGAAVLDASDDGG